MQRVIIFANGELPDPQRARLLLRPGDIIICADGGTRHALTLQVQPDLVIGDMDSAGKSQLQKLQQDGVALEFFPRDKDETDLELAVERAIAMQPGHILIMAGLGGRLDQTLANITLLADPRLAGLDVRLDDGVEEIFICRDQAQIRGQNGDLVSLIPWQGAVLGVQTQNLKYPLEREPLYPDKTRGVSNEMLGDSATVSVLSGLLLIVHRRQS